MGIIQQTNAEYYTGSDIQFYTDPTISGISANLEVILEDTSTSQAANYKIFYDPTGSAHLNNFIEYSLMSIFIPFQPLLYNRAVLLISIG